MDFRHVRGLRVSSAARSTLTAGLSGVGALFAFLTAVPVHGQSSAGRPPVPGAPGVATAFTNVAVIPMDTERVLPDQTVVIEKGRIAALGPSASVRVPAGATRIDGSGKYLIPGLGDCHTHIGYGKMNKDSLPSLAERTARAERRLFSWLADGVTTIRNMDYLEMDPAISIEDYRWYMNGEDFLRLRERAAKGELWSPRIYTAGQWVPIQYTPEHARHLAKRRDAEAPVPSLDSVIAYLKRYKAAGYDHIKVHSESEDMLDTLLAAVRQVEIPIGADLGGHRPIPGKFLEKALAAKVRSIEHFSRYPNPRSLSPEELQSLVTATVRAGTWNCATLGVGARGRAYIRPLQDAGGGLLLGTDAPLGPSVHKELEVLVKSGLTPYEALATGTKNMAMYFNTLDDVGTIEAGKRADLVLLTANPLENVSNTQQRAGVMIGGRWLAQDDIERRLAANAAAAKQGS